MTVSLLTTKHVYSGDGVTVNWPYTFPITATTDIKVYKTATDGSISLIASGYTVDTANSRVVYPNAGSPLTSSEKVTLLREVPLTQAVDYRNGGTFNAETLEAALDKTILISQQLDETLDRCVKYPVDENPSDVTTSAFLSTLETLESEAADAASNAATSQTAAASSATAAAASATTASTQATNAATSASAAATSATSAAGSATTATTQASTATTQASTATTQASNASTSATNASNSATAAAGSATTASTQATNAATSATNASNSATTASTQATNAGNSATAAATSASAAAASAASIGTPVPISNGGTNSTTALANNKAIVSSGGKIVEAAATTLTEIGYVNGVTSAIQTQLNTKAPTASPTLTGTVTIPDGTATTSAVSLQQLMNVANANIATNGGFEIWQRGTSFSCAVSKSYFADRYYQQGSGTPPTGTLSKETGAGNFETGTASLKVAISSNTSNASWFVSQLVENYEEFKGKTVTIAFRVKASSLTGTWFMGITDGVGNGTVTPTNSGSFTTFSASLAVSTSAVGLQIIFGNWFGQVGTGTLYIDSIMMTVGSVAMTYFPRLFPVEMMLCERYFVKIAGDAANQIIATGQCFSTTQTDTAVRLPARMRTSPTITINNPTNYKVTNSAAALVACTNLVATAQTPDSFELDATVAAGLTAGNASVLYSTNTNATIFIDAEM